MVDGPASMRTPATDAQKSPHEAGWFIHQAASGLRPFVPA
jgi:hypothetical protein